MHQQQMLLVQHPLIAHQSPVAEVHPPVNEVAEYTAPSQQRFKSLDTDRYAFHQQTGVKKIVPIAESGRMGCQPRPPTQFPATSFSSVTVRPAERRTQGLPSVKCGFKSGSRSPSSGNQERHKHSEGLYPFSRGWLPCIRRAGPPNAPA